MVFISFSEADTYILTIAGTGFDVTNPESDTLYWYGQESGFVEAVRAVAANSLEQVKADSQNARLSVPSGGYTDLIAIDLGTDSATITSVSPSGPLGGESEVKRHLLARDNTHTYDDSNCYYIS